MKKKKQESCYTRGVARGSLRQGVCACAALVITVLLSTRSAAGTQAVQLTALFQAAGNAAIMPITYVNAGVNGNPPYMLQSITAGGYTVMINDLALGTSDIVEGSATGSLGTRSDAADNFDLNDFVARTSLTGANAEWKIAMIAGREKWRDSNGDNADFFIFEVGGNDAVQVRAILSGGVLGEPMTITLSQWSNTGLYRSGQPNAGQPVAAVAFAVTELFDDAGTPLTNRSIIEGIHVTSGTLDPSCFCAVAGPPIPNNPPAVDAGEDQTIVWPFAKSVILAGTVSDDDPDDLGQLTLLWSKVSGTGEVLFDDSSLASTRCTFSAPGVYELKLEAWDELVQAGSDTVVINVAEPNCPPGDLTADCKVNMADLMVLADEWLSASPAVNLVGDPTIDMADFTFQANAWMDNWTGSITVTLSPSEAVAQGAQWRIDGAWRDSGARHGDLLPGPHVIRFKAIDDWLAPVDKPIEIGRGQSIIITGAYAQPPPLTLIISEFMAINIGIKADEKGEFDDWIEIHNFGETAIDLAGLCLTDNADKPEKWRFPADAPAATTVGPGEYLLVWADGESDEGPLHAAFSLASAKGDIALFAADAVTLIDSLSYGRQVPDVSAGRVSPADLQVRYFTVPTPKASNSSTYKGMVADTEFSHDRGFYEAPFDLEITCATAGAAIRYTLDGTRPTESNGQIYTEPISVAATTVLRAAAFLSGWLPTHIDTQTYIFLADVIRQPATIPGYPNPNTWLGGSSYATHDYEIDPQVVNSGAYSGVMLKALTDIPTLSLVTGRAAMDTFYWGSGESPASVELIYPADPDKNVQADCGVEPHSHSRMKRSLRLNFRSEYGNAKLRSSLFRDAPVNGDSAAEEADRIVLRGGNNRSWARIWNPERTTYTEDQWYRDSQIAMSGIGSHGTFVHLYINGLYWGLYNPVERPDAWFTSMYMGGEKEDWFAVSHDGAKGGSPARWNYLKGTLKDKNMSDPANYAEMQQYLNIDSFIDYLLLCWHMGLTDWPGNNWWGGNRNDVSGPFMYFAWDGEWAWKTTRDGHNNGWVHPDFRSNKSGGATLPALWHSLRRNSDFMMRFADRSYGHLFNGGALTDDNCKERFLSLNNYIRDAVVAESARWGDACKAVGHPTRTRDVDWVSAENEILSPGFMTGNGEKFIASLRAQGYYPTIDPPLLSRRGGTAPVGFQLAITNRGGVGTIYYTLDGADPREAVTGEAAGMVYSDPLTLTKSVVAKARVLSGGTWSALETAIFDVGGLADVLRITEIMYHPAAAPDGSAYDEGDFEYIELKNIGASPVNLNLVHFSQGLDFTFGDMVLPSGDYVVVVRNQAAFAIRYPAFDGHIAGEFNGALDNSGERIELCDAVGNVIHNFQYSDAWYDITDGRGFSLTIKDEMNAEMSVWGQKAGWRPSAEIGGSPGHDDSGIIPLLGSIVINELLAHSDTGNDWIELHNTTADQTIHIGGWFLSDSGKDLMKCEIPPGTILSPGGYAVFRQGVDFDFGLSENGETVYLTSGRDGVMTGYTDQESFGASEMDVSLGRYQKSGGTFNFVPLSSQTPGMPNAYPKVGPVVISEIMYNPGSNADAEYVELLNISDDSVVLYDFTTGAPWKLEDDGGFELFILDSQGQPVTLASGERILLVKNRTAFNGMFAAPAGIQMFEWSSGSLNNAGERIELSKPGDVNASGVRQYIRVDRVIYSDGSHPEGDDPWPASADGSGHALHRRAAAEYGNDVINWQAGEPTPGLPNNQEK
ncbi:MAG: lamin tail domain-containing protein [Phycisphaerae bacterium]|nr:lamin tail domain-containing protein [Phycisphaerae bacterium]